MNPKESMITIAKTFRWDMAHRLPFHTGGCQNIHGHTYNMDIQISGLPDRNGMLLDFGSFKSIVKPLIDQMDHAFVCWRGDSLMKNFLETTPFKVLYVDFQTTSENIALYFQNFLKIELQSWSNLRYMRIVIHETPSSFASVECALSEGRDE